MTKSMITAAQEFAKEYNRMTDAELAAELESQEDNRKFHMEHCFFVPGNGATMNSINARIDGIRAVIAYRNTQKWMAQAVATGMVTKEFADNSINIMAENAFGE